MQNMVDRLGEAGAIAHLGNAYFNEGNFDSSYVCNLQAIEIYKQVGSDHGLSQCLNNVGDIMMERNQFQLAKNYYSEAMKIRRNNFE